MKLALALLIFAAVPVVCHAQSGPSYDFASPTIALVSPTGSGPYGAMLTTGTSGQSFDYAATVLLLGYNTTTKKYYVCGTANPCTGGGSGGGSGSASFPTTYTSPCAVFVSSANATTSTCGTATQLQNATGLAAGVINLVSGVGTFTFPTAFTSTPICVPGETTALATVRITSVSTTAVSVQGTGTDVVNVSCQGGGGGGGGPAYIGPPVTTATCSGAYTIAFPATGDIAYHITNSANCTISITTPPAGTAAHHIFLRVIPAGFTTTFPASSSSLVWNGGSAPTFSTSQTNRIALEDDGSQVTVGNI